MYIFKAGVVGAGFMGAEIAQVITFSGLPVVVKDVDQDILDKAEAHIRSIYQGRVDKGKMSQSELMDKMDLVEFTLDYDEFEDADFIIEAVPESMDLKVQVFRELAEVAPETAIFASNTSALSISELGHRIGRAERTVGMHFFSPAHIMKLVEVIPGLDTAQEVVDDTVQFAESLRKIPVVVQECPGFLVNRLLAPYLLEAVQVLQEGAATAEQIDNAMVEFGMPMGPLTLLDFMGIDISAHAGMYMASEYGQRFGSPKLMAMMLEAGRLGEKSGAGFYGYGEETDEPVQEMISRIQAEEDTRGEFTVERLLFPIINEAARIAQENVAAVPDIDMAMIAGTGMTFQGQRMGPLAVADEYGLDVVLAGLESMLHEPWGGERFRPSQYLKTKVRAGHLGTRTGRGFHEHVGAELDFLS
ncbi:MAG: 3-hydroxyacyl-CoA dehydrogenase [Chloroflexota bacterium]|nr:3-hydroxyacyl-CoA dehydrogenase [Chloroflexota bacterium]